MRCIYNEPWIGRCTSPTLHNEEVCDVHSQRRCWCGSQGVRGCTIAVSLCCGMPLCSEHECAGIGYGFTGHGPHSEKGQQQYLEWKETQHDQV